jgi:hypothetical protein
MFRCFGQCPASLTPQVAYQWCCRILTNDDPVLYTAVAAGADVLCVKDRDFYDPNVMAFCKRQDIELMDDIALLRLLLKLESERSDLQ